MQTGVPTLHIYYEPFVRSDHTLRLLASPAIEGYTGGRPGSLSSATIRYKELWGDQGTENDQLLINGRNVCTDILCPISKQVNAFFAFDRNRDGQTDLSQPDPSSARCRSSREPTSTSGRACRPMKRSRSS